MMNQPTSSPTSTGSSSSNDGETHDEWCAKYLASLQPHDYLPNGDIYNYFTPCQDPIVDSLVFIVRLGNVPDKEACGFMGWKQATRTNEHVLKINSPITNIIFGYLDALQF